MAVSVANVMEKMSRLHLEPRASFASENGIDPEPDPIFYDALTHILLPKQVPGQQQLNLETIEEFLLKTFTNSLKGFLAEVPMPQLECIQQMLQKWETIQPNRAAAWNRSQFLANFPKQIGGLQEGHTIPIYVRNQNATLLIKKHLDHQSISVATFRPSLPSEIVMSNVSGAHLMKIPETMEIIQNVDMLKSQSFAQQLHELSTGNVDISLGKFSKGGTQYTATRDVADPKLVSDWLVGLLVPQKVASDKYSIEKKFRDQVSLNETKGSANFLPFRRSGMYMALKATVQLKLLENIGSSDPKDVAKLTYKIIMLRFLADTANQLVIKDMTTVDLASQMLAKLGRRVQKLVTFSNEIDKSATTPLPSSVMSLKLNCLERVAATVDRLTEKMKTIWNSVSSSSPNQSKITLNYQHDEKDLHHQIPDLDQFIAKLKASLSSSSPLSINQSISRITESDVFPRYNKAENILSVERSSLLQDSFAYVWLHDTENFIKYSCDDGNMTPDQLSQLLLLYFTKALSHYKEDPVGKSQIYLVSLKGLEILDKITTREYPLLLEYKPEVNLSHFDHLLLPFKKDMVLLDGLLTYFRNRKERASLDGILSSNAVNSKAFCVKYAQQDNTMIRVRSKILAETDAAIKSKFAEVQKAIQTCKQLQSQIDAVVEVECSCTYRTETYYAKRSKQWRERQVKVTCERCKAEKNLQDQLQSTRHSVFRYEKPLPVEETLQWAVIFELWIPQRFAIYREYLAHVKYIIWGDKIFNGGPNHKNIIWMDYKGLKSYTGGHAQQAKTVKLGSPTMASSLTYHTHTWRLDVIDDKQEEFVINNGLGCSYFFDGYQDRSKATIQEDCAFKLKSTSNHGPYSGSHLQCTLESTNHTQNGILARQNECHQKLGLEEFIAFGSLRAGYRIQLRNLFEAIFSGSLSLEQESVLALILQTIWQMGPKNWMNCKWESHLDFGRKDSQFAEEFLDMMDKLVKTNEANYSNSLIVLVAIIITRRIADLNGALDGKCYAMVKSWRKILSTWISKIEEALDKPEVASVHGGVPSLRKNLLEIVLCSMLSYSVAGSESVSMVIKDQDDVVFWFETLFQWNQFEDQPVSTSQFFKILQNFVKSIPLRLNLERQLSVGNGLMVESLKNFISKRWNKTKECTFIRMVIPYSLRNKESLVLIEYLEVDPETGERITHQITFDFLRGRFLVNGYCQSTLPLEVKNDKLFQMYFKDATNLRIQRDNQILTRTVVPFHGRHYEFHQTDWNLLIKEVQDNPVVVVGPTPVVTKLILLDPQIFFGVVSNYFIDNYSHWLDTTNLCVYFRPNAKLDDDHSHHYTLKRIISGGKSRWILFDEKIGAQVLSIYSTGFKKVTKALERLEMEIYINVSYQRDSSILTATLRRYNLRFTINLLKNGKPETTLESVEYPGYKVSCDQYSLGTLIGLCQGLLMERGEKRLILVPHATIKYSNGLCHQNVSIGLSGDLRQPPCFVYEVDDVLRRLKAHNSKPAWLYLAALHAVTSSPFSPDPFTEVTGTEMAVDILQSASVCSCSPYDPESLSTLKFIKDLSPKRKWYGHLAPRNKHKEDKGSMEITKWPQGISSMVAYEGYAIIVDKLIEESNKLAVLHENYDPKSVEKRKESPENISEWLCLRGYLRSLAMYNSATAGVQFPSYFTSSQVTIINQSAKYHSLSLRMSSAELNIPNMQSMSVASLCRSVKILKSSGLFKKSNLADFVITQETLNQNLPQISLEYVGGFQDLLSLDFRSNWLRLYTMAICCKTPEDFHLFGIILSAAAYRGASLEQLANLHCISVFSAALAYFRVVPSYLTSNNSAEETTCYPCPANNTYEISMVHNILERHAKPFTALPVPVAPTQPSTYNFYGISTEEFQKRHEKYKVDKEKYDADLKEYRTQKAAFEQQIKTSCSTLSAHFKHTFWPHCKSIPMDSVSKLLESHNFYSTLVVTEMNNKLEVWYRNHKFKLFVEDVQAKLNSIWDNLDKWEGEISLKAPVLLQQAASVVHGEQNGATKKVSASLESFLDGSKAIKLEECLQIFQSGRFEHTCNPNDFLSQRSLCKEKAQNIRLNLVEMITSKISNKIIYRTGITPRLSPISILKYLVATKGQQVEGLNVVFLYAGALAVLWTHLKRLNRCVRAQNEGDLQREKDNLGHSNWSPKEHPEWLLLELELDIMIRPIQVEVANQMIKMPNGTNGVTQLNMGEGKTSVIVPMLCANLAQKNSQLCRVTVLSSMFKMNLNSLTFSIGGLLNKRVYSVPCRRDMLIDEECVNKIGQAYHECLDKEGVILTLPEYRLSFRLLAYDKMYKKEWSLGGKMLDVENFLRNYARDVLDESDELFSVKYQLVYTIGEQVPIDGGDLRWICCQKILDAIPKVGEVLFRKFGGGMVEFHEASQKKSPHQFSTFRLLGNEVCLKEFRNLVADLMLSQIRISDKDKKIVKRFLTEEHVSLEDHQHVMNKVFCQDSPDILQRTLLYSGYLRRGVLGLALTKRWRVEYGVNSKPNFPRLMAIPFRAKDVAAEKTEFGHPDLAIILTHLSYYYSGLSNKQLQEVFDILKGKQSPDAIYSQWISKIPRVPDFLERYYSLNMKDAHQKAKLFETLRRHKMVIDFWLSHCVFPRESKQFPGKLVMTAWDLCYERQRLAVTGFSGTNDSQVLLPLMITQQDLKQLEDTNENMTKTLLRPENGINHKGFPMGVTCQQILETMKQDNLTVLIDAGALMLECSNEQVANLWLAIDPTIEAAVYFNEKNELLVKTRGDQKKRQGTPFEVSPYQARLDKCGVFLDDQHTRGTDLKFPVGSKACVTVATRMKRDKLIQACMRMRKLGQGHSVTFYLSHEARDKIKGNGISTQGVLDWVCENTRESNQDGLLYWALAGRNYAQRLAAEDNFHFPNYQKPYQRTSDDNSLSSSKMLVLAKQCVDDEVVKLMDMFGHYTKMELLTQLISKWFTFTKQKLERSGRVNPTILVRVDKICEEIVGKCKKYIPTKLHVSSDGGSMMEEEQEKELELEIEVEVEEEREVERPRKANEAKHELNEKVRRFAIYGGNLEGNGDCFVKLPNIFENTTFWGQVQPECWTGDVFATKDFVRTVGSTYRWSFICKNDRYLRPVQYLISCTSPSSSSSSKRSLQLLVISPFEANELLPIFRDGQTQVCKLHMFSTRRREKQDLLLNNQRLQLPSFNLVEGDIVPDCGPEMVSLFLASGSLYFDSMKEQRAFLYFLGLFPPPWTKVEGDAFEKGWITKTGFLLPQHRDSKYEQGFQKDPTGLIRKILGVRHCTVSEVTHLMQILNEHRCVDLD